MYTRISKQIIMKEKTLGIIRHALTFVGGVLVTQGVIDDALFMELFGAVMTLVGGVWSVVDKKKAEVEA
tara:strand:+ start:492 stop:698 length:207 start_codon:yes stop_codon:yes gene_type:complete